MSLIDDILRREGGPTNDPDDPGGRTAYGISERYHPELWRDGPPTETEARAFYAREFDRLRLLSLGDASLAAQVFDFCQHAGPDDGIGTLQRLVGAPADGIIGPRTIAAVRAYRPPKPAWGVWLPASADLNRRYAAARLEFYVRTAKAKYLRGFIRRGLEFLQ